MNVRTYVRGPDGQRGIWFFSLEADRALAVIGARLSYGLPYRWAKMSVRCKSDKVEYTSDRYFGRGRARILVLRHSPVQPSERELFLTARFRLYTKLAGRLAFAQVDHPPWPLESASALELEQNVIEGSGVPAATGNPIVHFSPGTAVRVGRPMFNRG